MVILLLVLLYLYGRFIEPYRLSATKLELNIDGYFRSIGTITIAHISDLHVIKTGPRETSLIEMVKSLNPDIILITGDFIKTGADPLETSRTVSQLSAPLGVWGVPGNIDQTHGEYPRLLNELEKAGVNILRNQRQRITKGGLEFDLIGLDPNPGDEVLGDLFKTRRRGYPEIVLVHWPYLIEKLALYHPQLILCGHTHGGQIRLPVIGAWGARFLAGTHYDQGLFHILDTWVHVSRGVGMTYHQVRLFCPPEVALLTVTFSNLEFE